MHNREPQVEQSWPLRHGDNSLPSLSLPTGEAHRTKIRNERTFSGLRIARNENRRLSFFSASLSPRYARIYVLTDARELNRAQSKAKQSRLLSSHVKLDQASFYGGGAANGSPSASTSTEKAPSGGRQSGLSLLCLLASPASQARPRSTAARFASYCAAPSGDFFASVRNFFFHFFILRECRQRRVLAAQQQRRPATARLPTS